MGFLLTASPVWTGGPALAGTPLALLFALWGAGRLSMGVSGWVPLWLVATVDAAFLPTSDLGAPVPAAAGLHALTAGGMGATILAVMTRVGLGHTGRPLVLPLGAVGCYALVHGAALGRIAATFAEASLQRSLLLGSGLAWAGAFALFAARYWRILTRPRPDGRAG